MTESPAPRVTPVPAAAALRPQGLLHLARRRPPGPAYAGLILHTCAPAARACAPAPHRRQSPAPRSRRGPAAPDSRRQGPSPSRPKAGGKRSRGKPPLPSPAALPASPRPPVLGGRRRPPAPGAPAQPRPEARRGAGRTRQLWQRERRNHGGGRRAAPGRDPVPVAPGLAGLPGPWPGPGVRAPNLAALGARRARPTGRTHSPALREAAGMCAVKFGL